MSGQLPIVIIACQVFEEMLAEHLPASLRLNVTYLDYGLHRVPQKIANTIQPIIDELETPSLVVLGYGLCGNGISGIRSGVHTLVVPRMDDCISMLLGSYSAYMREFESVPGTYYLSKGWLESGSHPLKEYQEYETKYGPEDAIWLLDTQYQHYERVAFVAHNTQDLDRYREQATAVADFCARWGMRYEEILGSDQFIRRLAEVAVDVTTADDDFVIIPPGGVIRLDQFMR